MAVDGLDTYDLRVSGVRLNNYSYNVSMVSGVSQLPARNLISVPGPRRDGSVPIPGRYTEPPTIIISAWISDRNPNGSISSTPDIQFEKNWTAFLNAFVSQGATVPVERLMPDGTIRKADCRVSAAVIPDLPSAGGSRIAEVSISLDIPSIFWIDASGTFSQTYSAFNQNVSLNFLQPSNAPITDAIYKVTGPINNPEISNTYGGFCRYNGNLAAGDVWTIDPDQMTSKVNGSSVLFQTSYYHNAGYLFEVWPNYTVRVAGSGTTSASKWSVTANKKFF